MHTAQKPEDKIRQAELVLIAAGLIKPLAPDPGLEAVSEARRRELAQLYGEAGPVSELIIADRDAR